MVPCGLRWRRFSAGPVPTPELIVTGGGDPNLEVGTQLLRRRIACVGAMFTSDAGAPSLLEREEGLLDRDKPRLPDVLRFTHCASENSGGCVA